MYTIESGVMTPLTDTANGYCLGYMYKLFLGCASIDVEH